MSQLPSRKNPICFPPLVLVRIESPDEWLERRMREWATAGKVGGDGPIATDALAYTARGKRWPMRLLARLIGDGLDAGCTAEWADELPDICREYLRLVKRRRGLQDSQPDQAA